MARPTTDTVCAAIAEIAFTRPFVAMADSLRSLWQAIVHAWGQIVHAWGQIPTEVFVGLYTAWIVFSIVFLLAQRRRPTATLAWLIGFLSVPLVSVAMYFLFGPRKLQRRRLKRDLAKTVASRIADIPRGETPSTLASRNWLASLANVPVFLDNSPARASWRVGLLFDGDSTYEAIEAAIAKAESQIHLEYYIFDPDEIGLRWRDLLAERARAGVKVRVLLDALGSPRGNERFWAPLDEAGGEVRLFNPLRILRIKPGIMNFRTHRKIVVIDGRIAFTGGINVTKGNSGSSSGKAAWRDTHVEIHGPPVLDLQRVFLEDWLYAGRDDSRWARRDQRIMKTPADIERWFPDQVPPADTPYGDSESIPWVQIIDSGPDDHVPLIHRFVFTAISLARQRCWITTPYFVPDEPIFTAIVAARNRGVDVRVIIPEEGDSKFVTAAARTFAEEVAFERVAVFEYRGRMIHAKTMVIDEALSIVGTANLDNRSFRLNFEVIAAIYDKATNAALGTQFEKDLQMTVPLDPDPQRQGMARRMLGSAARLFAPLL
ncbi:MAG: cardiolipin synthase [Burkholderiaceae bacterium]